LTPGNGCFLDGANPKILLRARTASFTVEIVFFATCSKVLFRRVQKQFRLFHPDFRVSGRSTLIAAMPLSNKKLRHLW
jgi:hypothetical protein